MELNYQTTKAYLVGGGIGSLAAAAFMIRDGGLPGGNISILEAALKRLYKENNGSLNVVKTMLK